MKQHSDIQCIFCDNGLGHWGSILMVNILSITMAMVYKEDPYSHFLYVTMVMTREAAS